MRCDLCGAVYLPSILKEHLHWRDETSIFARSIRINLGSFFLKKSQVRSWSCYSFSHSFILPSPTFSLKSSYFPFSSHIVNYCKAWRWLYRDDNNVLTSQTADKSSLEQSPPLCLFCNTHYILMRLGKSLFCFCVLFESPFPFFHWTNAKPAACRRKEGISFGGTAPDWLIEKITAPLTLSPL